MYFCPVCNRSFEKEDAVRRHYLACWRERNPSAKSTPAPHLQDISVSFVDDDVMRFFEGLK